MKLVPIFVLSFCYGLLFHGVSHLWPMLFGPASTATDEPRDLMYLLLSSVAAASIVTSGWYWRYRSLVLRDALASGAFSVALVLANIVLAKGITGLGQMFTQRPIHACLVFLLAFVAVPVCFAAGRFRAGQ